MIIADTITAKRAAVGAAAVNVTTTMAAGSRYVFTSSTACYIKQGSAPTATAGDGSMLVPANTPVYLHGSNGATLSVIQAAAGGDCTVTQVRRLGND